MNEPTMNMRRSDLLDYIDAVSLAVVDTVLFLDTHPKNTEALEYFKECSKMRNAALDEYAKRYGPLTVDTVTLSDDEYWNWIDQPWPWEEGGL